MSSQQRDQAGRFSGAGNAGGADVAVHTPAGAAAPAGISSSSDPAQRGASSSIPDGSADDPGNLHSATSALLNRPIGGRGGGGMRGTPVGPPVPPSYAARYRSLGLSGNEVGGGQMQTQEGPSQHGRDIDPGGVPAPAGDTLAGGDAAGGEAATAGAELANLAPLAAL
jgi:hypothetical protein